MFKIIDYAAETVKDNFPSAAAAYHYLALTFSTNFIHEMGLKVVRKEEEDERDKAEL